MISRIAVLIPTYRRPKIVPQTVQRLQKHLSLGGQTPSDKIDYFVGDDSPDDETRRAMERVNLPHTTWVESPRRGLGANLNYLLRRARDYAYVIQLDDDHWLVKPMDLDPLLTLMEANDRIGCIRLMGVAGHRYQAELHGSTWWLRWSSPELYLASNRPHLKSPKFHAYFGGYPEGVRLGETEEMFCHAVKTKGMESPDKAPVIAVPLELATESSWEHVGDSWQKAGM